MSELIKKGLAALEAKVATLKAEIAAADITLEESKAANELVLSFINNMKGKTEASEEEKAAMAKALDDSDLYRKVKEVERYEDTLAADLVEVTTRWVVTEANTPLLSPAGFSGKVFVKNPVMKMVDSLSGISGPNLVAYDMNEV